MMSLKSFKPQEPLVFLTFVYKIHGSGSLTISRAIQLVVSSVLIGHR